MPAERKRVAGYLVLLILIAPLTTADIASWNGPPSVNTGGGTATIQGFEVPGNATVLDAWMHVSDSPMANSNVPATIWDSDEIANGTMAGTTMDLLDEHLSLEDDLTRSSISNLDDGNYTITLSSTYTAGPNPLVMTEFESTNGYNPHPHCNNLTGYNLSAGYDIDDSGDLSSNEITSSHYLCQTDQVIQGGNGRVDNGTLVNGTFMTYETIISEGNATCPDGGKVLVYGNDFGYFYDDLTGLNSTEEQGELYFCNLPTYWAATNMELNGTIVGSEQTLSHGVVPASAIEGSVLAGTLPGDPLPADTDSWLIFPVSVLPASKHSNYTLSYDIWYHLDGSEAGAWFEYRAMTSSGWGPWTWIQPEGGYTYSISHTNLSVNGAPGGALPVYSGTGHSGWVSDQFNLSTIPGMSTDSVTDMKFRIRTWTSENSALRPGVFIDNILVSNDGTGGGAWHHGCDVNGYSYTNHGTYCYYSNSVIGNLQMGVNLSNVASLIFSLHWDLEGSGWDNACFEISNNGGTTWTDISSTGASGSTTTQCRSRSGPIPGSGYTDLGGNTHYDDSGGAVDVEFTVPQAYRVSSAQLKIVVQTDSSVQYGSSSCSPFPCDPDGREGLTVFHFTGLDGSGGQLFYTDMGSASVTTHASSGVNEWRLLQMNSGLLAESHGFEDSSASAPETDDSAGFQRGTTVNNCETTQCKFVRGSYSDSDNTGSWGPARSPSYPYSYAIGGEGSVLSVISNAWLQTPMYDVSMNGITEFVFDHWVCFNYFTYVGGALFIQVNGGSWQHYDPGWYTTTMYSFGSVTALDGLGIWTTEHCGTDEFVTVKVDLSAYRGDQVRFRFIAAAKYSDQDSGWFIDNVGLRQANFSSPGTWLSQEFQLGQDDLFDTGIIEILGSADDYANNTLTGTLLDSNTMEPIPGFSEVDFPISLAGLDVDTYSQFRLKLNLDTQNPLSSPMVNEIRIGGSRILSAAMGGINGWQISNDIEVIDSALNATQISGTITSDYMHSQRPIKGLSFSGNSSSNVYVEVFDAEGNSLGGNTKGSDVAFTTPQTGYALEISLPTNGFITTLLINHDYGEPARDPSVDAAADGSIDWSFPSSLGRGHYAWQTKLIPDAEVGSTEGQDSVALSVDTSGTSIYTIVPVSSYVNSGLISVSSDADGFESPVSVSVAGASFSTGSSNELFTTTLSTSQLYAINSLSSGWTDPDTNRDWRVVQISITSTSQQYITVSGLALGYTIFENVSGLGGAISDYHDANTQDDPPPEEIYIPFEFSSAIGAISVDGDLVYSFFVTNREFQVPNTLYPDGNSIEIVTRHHHLNDNSEIASISLTGSASDGESLEFLVEIDEDGLWGQGSDVSFIQNSGSGLAPLDLSASYVEILPNTDGYDDVVVHWIFKVNWNWDDVSTINWAAKAMIANGETVWPATAVSGQFGMKAVENDIQIDTFEVRDGYDRLLSNQFSTFYPFTIQHGSDVNVSGTVRFQDSQSHRPTSDDFSVGLNLSGNLYSLTAGDGGTFSGIISPPSSLSELSLSPIVISIGPSTGAIGAEDTSGSTTQVTVRVDANPPTLGPIEISTDIGLQPANGKVWEPTNPISVFVTSDESEARGEEITLRYWREGIDDLNMDGVAEESEYLSIPMPLSSGLTGQQQIQFPGIDVSGVASNGLLHMYIEGTDWAGNSYQDGGTGGGPGDENAWSTVVIATDEPTSLVSSGFDLDHEIGYLLAGVPHVFSLQINEPNGLQTLDNITVMLCGDGPSNLGEFSYDPSTGALWSAHDSMVTPLSAQSAQVDSEVILLSLGFELSWDYPWQDGQLGCKPGVSIEDDLNTVAYMNNIAQLSWQLDNRLMAIPDILTDMTPPVVDMVGESLYLRQGDQFGFEGIIVYAGSQVTARNIPENLQVEVEVIYGTQAIESLVDVDSDGLFEGSITLPSRVPLNPVMSVSTSVLNIPGAGYSEANSDLSVVVDSKPPQALFNMADYPDSSLTILDSDLIGDVTVTVTMVDEIGMTEGPLQVSWVYIRANAPISDTEDSGELSMIIDGDTNDVYQSIIDMTPANGMKIEPGDQIWFWITSTDKSGNEIIGSGSETAPRQVTVRIMEFLGSYSRSVVTPTMNPTVGEILIIETFWENPGKRDGEISVGLYELVDGEQWIQSLSTNRDGLVTISLPAESSSVYADFEWESWQSGQPNLYLILDEDFENPYQAITGINVRAPADEGEGESDSQIMLYGGIAAVAVLVVAVMMSRGRGDEDFYYEEDDESYYEEESWTEDDEDADADVEDKG